jgi:hypothetical protein
VAEYNPDRVTKDNVECMVKVHDGSLRGICTQYIAVGCKYSRLLFVSIVVVVVATAVGVVALSVSVVDGVVVEDKNFCGCNT